ncbi:MAG: cation diffusion facilitator family transporter [Candidatus Eisenbacteria bacterium]
MKADRARDVARVLWAILGLNLVVAAAKLYYGHQSGAIAITADGIHSALDGLSNVLGLVGLAVARRPPDANHPYGHRKYETVAALGVAAMLFIGCQEILSSAFERMRHPRLPEVSALGFVVILGTIGINVFVVWIERREGRRLKSELLQSDAAHTGSDVLASVLVLVSFSLAPLRQPWVDLVAALVIVGFILRSGWDILRHTLSTLSDERRIDPTLVQEVALLEAGVLEAHNVRSRGPDDDIHLDLHILVDPDMAIAAAHEIGHRVEARLRHRWEGLTDVVVHIEPALESERARPGEDGELKAEG